LTPTRAESIGKVLGIDPDAVEQVLRKYVMLCLGELLTTGHVSTVFGDFIATNDSVVMTRISKEILELVTVPDISDLEGKINELLVKL
jgi:hypothetical protein